jgi:hypothetical protein
MQLLAIMTPAPQQQGEVVVHQFEHAGKQKRSVVPSVKYGALVRWPLRPASHHLWSCFPPALMIPQPERARKRISAGIQVRSGAGATFDFGCRNIIRSIKVRDRTALRPRPIFLAISATCLPASASLRRIASCSAVQGIWRCLISSLSARRLFQ